MFPAISRRRARRAERGFTLVELMVVMFIMALASTAVILTLPDGTGKLRQETQRFAGRVSAARDQAILSSQPMAVTVSPSGYAFSRRAHGRWLPLEDRPFATTAWAYDAYATAPGRIVFDGTGATEDQAVVTLIRGQRQLSVSVAADGKVAVIG